MPLLSMSTFVARQRESSFFRPLAERNLECISSESMRDAVYTNTLIPSIPGTLLIEVRRQKRARTERSTNDDRERRALSPAYASDATRDDESSPSS